MASDSFTVSLLGVQAMLTIFVTIYLYKTRSLSHIPCFVTIQMIFLNLFWMCSATYYTLLYMKNANKENSKVEEHQTQNMNIVATCGDAFFILHDWIFTEQIFSVSLSIPIVIDMFKN